MDKSLEEGFVKALYDVILGRKPGKSELVYWIEQCKASSDVEQIVCRFRSSEEYKRTHGVKSKVPAGHFYSPIVNPNEVHSYVSREQGLISSQLPALNIDLDAMTALCDEWSHLFSRPTYSDEAGERRFYINNGSFPYGDAAALRAWIRYLRPRNVIEIGSGNSTACMLDAFDEFELGTKLTCIEPYPNILLNKVLSPHDRQNVRIIDRPVQTVNLSEFDVLVPGDILFIDSTHVLKTGSDVHYELCYILPCIKSGVIVHIHDCLFPFEYHGQWIFEDNWSWNEAYATRLFLMYNKSFRIRFWLSLLKRERPKTLGTFDARLLSEAGSSIWVEKVSDA